MQNDGTRDAAFVVRGVVFCFINGLLGKRKDNASTDSPMSSTPAKTRLGGL